MSLAMRCNNCAAPGATTIVYRLHRNYRLTSYMTSFILCDKCWSKRDLDSYWIPEYTDLETARAVLVTMILSNGQLPTADDLYPETLPM
jgi:hypothetical protein